MLNKIRSTALTGIRPEQDKENRRKKSQKPKSLQGKHQVSVSQFCGLTERILWTRHWKQLSCLKMLSWLSYLDLELSYLDFEYYDGFHNYKCLISRCYIPSVLNSFKAKLCFQKDF